MYICGIVETKAPSYFIGDSKLQIDLKIEATRPQNLKALINALQIWGFQPLTSQP